MNLDHLEYLCKDFNLGSNPVAEENHEGVLNKNYLVTTDEGKFFVKSIREKRRPSLPYIAEVEEFFYGKGIPAIRMLVSNNGNKVEEYDSETYTVYPFIESVRTHVYGGADFERMGEMLGRIHLVGSKDIPTFLSQKPFDEKPTDLILGKLQEYRERIKVPQNEIEKLFQDYIQLKLDMLGNTFSVEPLPMDTLTHGDYHARNLLLNSNREIIGVLDWEQSSMNARAYELTRSLLYVCFEGEGESHEYQNEKAIRSAKAFIKGYSSIYPISSDELIGGIKLRWKKLIYSFWIEEQYFVRNDSRSNKFIPHEMRLIKDFSDGELLGRILA